MDFMILDGIQKLHSPLLDTLFVCITRLGDKGFVWCLMALVFLLILVCFIRAALPYWQNVR